MPTDVCVAKSTADSARAAGTEAGSALAAAAAADLDPKLCIVFASVTYDLTELLVGLRGALGDVPTLGCTSASQFTHQGVTNPGVSAALISSDEMHVQVEAAQQWTNDPKAAVAKVLQQFNSNSSRGEPFWRGRTLLFMADGLRGGIETLVRQFTAQSGMRYQIFGSVAADDVQFKETFVFHGSEVSSGAFTCAEILSAKPFGLGYGHGWVPEGRPLRVTHVDGACLIELNGRPAWDAYREFAAGRGDSIAPGEEQGYLISHVLGLVQDGTYKLRVPLINNADGSLSMAMEVMEGDVVRIMCPEVDGLLSSGKDSLANGRQSLAPGECAGGILIECAATQLQLGERFSERVAVSLTGAAGYPLLGSASYGQVVRAIGGVTGVSCASSVSCLIPK